MNQHPLVLAITGASGAIYATRLLEVLTATGHDVYLTISPAGQTVLAQELDLKIDLDNFHVGSLMQMTADISTDDSNVLSMAGGGPWGSEGSPSRS